MAQQAGKAAPAVVVVGALAAGPQVPEFAAASTAPAAGQVVNAHLDAVELSSHDDAAELSSHAASRTYTVRAGDTLAGIAQRFYGNPEDWRWLFHVNRSKISNPNLIFVGEVLRIPHDPPAGKHHHQRGKHHRDGNGEHHHGKHHQHGNGNGGHHHGHGRHHRHLHGTLGCHGLEELWESVGGRHRAAETAASIAMAESGGNQYATGPFGERGYWQINPVNGPTLSTYNARGNAHAALVMSHNGRNWSPWTTYVDGAYRGRC